MKQPSYDRQIYPSRISSKRHSPDDTAVRGNSPEGSESDETGPLQVSNINPMLILSNNDEPVRREEKAYEK